MDRRPIKNQPFIVRPYTLNIRIENQEDKHRLESYRQFLMEVPNQFPFIAVTNPNIDLKNNTISLLVGSLITDMDQNKIDRKVLRYAQSYEPMIGNVGLDIEVERFRDIFVLHLCEYCRDLHRNHGVDDYVFSVDIIRGERDAHQPGGGGFGIMGWDESYLQRKLMPAMVSEGLIETSGEKFKITEVGLNYCAQIKRPVT